MSDNKLARRVRIPDEILPPEPEPREQDIALLTTQMFGGLVTAESFAFFRVTPKMIQDLLPPEFELCYDTLTRCFHIRKRP